MSDSWILLKPSIEEPSNPFPSANASPSSCGVIANDFSVPSTSVNHSRMNSTPRSSTVRSTNSASLNSAISPRVAPPYYGSVNSRATGSEAMTMAFRGWKDEALQFFEGLEVDNSKTYWQANKAVYEHEVRAPMEELLAELEPSHGAGKIFRPYRDVRFSADKSPYKTNIAATLGDGYISLSADGLGAGCGMYQMATDQL